jgi:hypothetical protein
MRRSVDDAGRPSGAGMPQGGSDVEDDLVDIG